MKKKIISLITLLVCTSLVTACKEEESSSVVGDETPVSSDAYNYGDISGGETSTESSSISGGETNNNELDALIVEFVKGIDVNIPSTSKYNLEYEVLYYYAYQQYFISIHGEDADNIIADEYAELFTEETNLTSLNDDDEDDPMYPVSTYGYLFSDANQKVMINFMSDSGHFTYTIFRYDGLYGTVDVSNVDTSWYVDYINFSGCDLLDAFPADLIISSLGITADITIPSIEVNECAALFEAETSISNPDTFYVVLEGDQMLDYAAILDGAGYTADIVEHTGEEFDWDLLDYVEYKYYTAYGYDAGKSIYISMQLDDSGNTLIIFNKFTDLFTLNKTSNTDWTNADKELMNETLHQVLPFMAFGDDYVLYDGSDEDWDYLILEDTYYEDLSSEYITLLVAAGFFPSNDGYYDYYYLDNGTVLIEIYVDYDNGNYLEIYFSESQSTSDPNIDPNATSHTLNAAFFGIEGPTTNYDTYRKTVGAASYEAQACAGNDADNGKGLQIRSKNSNSGVIGRYQDRTCKFITFVFDAKTEVPNQERSIEIYASNTPFTIADMYGSSVTKVATIKFDKNNLTKTYTFTENYSYIGFRSASGAVYLKSVEVDWGN